MNADTPLPDTPRLTPAVRALIAVSVGMVFVQLVWAPEFLADAFGFRWSRLSDRWWSVATYLFVHAGLLHVATNMFTLYVFGPRVEHEWGTGRFLRFYAACGLAGLALHALFATDGAPLIGASSAVFGVLVAYAATWPTDDIFLFGVVPMRVWSVVWLLIGINLLMGVTTSFAGGGNVAYFAHIGGALAGWFYMRTPPGAGLDQLRHRVSRVPDAEEPPRAIDRKSVV